jgi:hypothetical protein
MALNATTLTAAIAATDNILAVASATGITAPLFQGSPTGVPGTGSIVYLLVEQEWMQVISVSGLNIGVKRGMLGSCAGAHGNAAPVLSGLNTDFPGPVPISVKATQDFEPAVVGWSPVVAIAANVVAASGAFFHVTGTTIVKTITQPPGTSAISGQMIGIVFDGSGAGITWDATGNIGVAGTAGTAGTLVFFVFDANISKWLPSRIL